MIDELSTSGAMPALEMMMRFSAQRQRILAHNIANLDTPDFRPLDVSPTQFQGALRKAVARRRAAGGSDEGPLDVKSTSQFQVDAHGNLSLHPKTPSGNILFHDRNNRDLERSMQDLAENVAVFRIASDLYKSRVTILQAAISERA